ncbi:MAG: Crp/Fnr family transcriptional regulator [Variovorax sp.]
MPPAVPDSPADPTSTLPPHVLKLAALGVQRRYRTHAVLINEGDRGDAIYVVLAGRLRAFVSDARGREATLSHHGPGEYVGEMSLDGGPRSASVQAVEPTLCAVVTRETVLRHIAAEPDFAMGLILRLIRRARLATESARSMALLDVYTRLKLLLEERAQLQADGKMVVGRLTHQTIASEIGCSREMVSRLLMDLKRGAYLLDERSTLTILKPLPARW